MIEITGNLELDKILIGSAVGGWLILMGYELYHTIQTRINLEIYGTEEKPIIKYSGGNAE